MIGSKNQSYFCIVLNFLENVSILILALFRNRLLKEFKTIIEL